MSGPWFPPPSPPIRLFPFASPARRIVFALGHSSSYPICSLGYASYRNIGNHNASCFSYLPTLDHCLVYARFPSIRPRALGSSTCSSTKCLGYSYECSTPSPGLTCKCSLTGAEARDR